VLVEGFVDRVAARACLLVCHVGVAYLKKWPPGVRSQ
jgi:hypothetical protein